MLTYRKLKEHLMQMDEDRLLDHVTICLTESDEFIPVTSIEISTENECDVLDEGHTVLLIEA